jgi:ribosome-binding protein aMBF1 (putative translation factor)
MPVNETKTTKVQLTEKQIDSIRRKIDQDLLKEISLSDKLKTLRDISDQTNAGLAEMLGEKKRTFESWISGRYIPEGDKLKEINNLLVIAARKYIEAVVNKRKPNNIYNDFPVVFRLLDFNDAITTLISFFADEGITVDYESGKLSL